MCSGKPVFLDLFKLLAFTKALFTPHEAPKIYCARETHSLHGQALPPPESPSFEHKSASLCAHAFQETMHALSAAFFWLPGALRHPTSTSKEHYNAS